MPARDDHDIVWKNFHDAVNMAPAEIEEWLETGESRKVGFKRDGGESVGHASGRRIVAILRKAKAELDGGESVGHASGRRIVAILRKAKAELDGGDYAHMRKVAGFVKRHRAQGPHEEFRIPTSRWRYSLMNWGHDPLRD